MMNFAARSVALVLRPARAWQAIAAEPCTVWRVFTGHLLPAAAIAPIAYQSGLFWRAGWPAGAVEPQTYVQFFVLSPLISWTVSVLAVFVIAAVINLMIPVFDGRRDFARSFAVAAYGLTPAWLSCIVFAAPLQRVPLLTTILLIGGMHSCYLFYLGVQSLLHVPEKQAAECTALTLGVSLFASTLLGYAVGMLGLLPSA
jgi:hypothetical protein